MILNLFNLPAPTSNRPPRPSPPIRALAALLLGIAGPALAQTEDAELAAMCPEPALSPLKMSTPQRDDSPLIMYAREMDAAKSQLSEARGQVEIIRADQRLTTEQVLFVPETKTVIMPEPLAGTFYQPFPASREQTAR